MKVLLHYTTKDYVFSLFSKEHKIVDDIRKKEIEKFYNKYHYQQKDLFFIVYLNTSPKKYVVTKIIKKDNEFYTIEVDKITSDLLLNEMGIKCIDTYTFGVYYKEFTIPDECDFFFNNIINTDDDYSFSTEKIKLKYYTWDELINDIEILHSKLVDILFDKENVLNLATLYLPKQIQFYLKKDNNMYLKALNKIGFISSEELNLHHNVLHGDIGEFLMSIMMINYFSKLYPNGFFYPKLTKKSDPKMAVHGNDGTIAISEKKEIYYVEAKFYTELSKAIYEAVKSLHEHNQEEREDIILEIPNFRSISTFDRIDIIDDVENWQEGVILFLMCEDKYKEADIVKQINSSSKLKEIIGQYNIIVFVLPVLDKDAMLNLFAKRSVKVGEELYGR